MDNNNYKNALDTIKKYDRIIIHRHTHPDGDAIGSQVGIARCLKLTFPDKEIYQVGDAVGRYNFIDSSTMDDIPDSYFNDALSIILDTSSEHMISDQRYKSAKYTLRFDHHLFIKPICDVEIIDSSYESCAGLVTDFILSMGLKLDKASAEALFVGIVTDSGRFLYDSVSSRTHESAAKLLEYGLDTQALFSALYSEDFSALKRKAEFINKIKFTKNKVAWIYTSSKELEEYGLTAHEISRSMVNIMANIKDVHIWVNFTQCDDKILCELRSDLYNINPIAVKYGGGGHKKASGAMINSYTELQGMLDDLDNI